MFQDSVPADRISAAFHGVASEQINPAAQAFRQFLTHCPQFEQPHASVWLKLDEQIDVTARMGQASGVRPKEMNTQHRQIHAHRTDRRPDRFQIGEGSQGISHA